MADTPPAAPRADVPTTNFNFQDPSFAADPWPGLHQLQALGPVLYHEGRGQYLFTGYRDCAHILYNSAQFASDEEFFVGLFGGATMECMDRPRHTAVRGIWARQFRRSSLESMRETIERIVDRQVTHFLDRLRSDGRADAIGEMIRAIPTLVIAEMMGIPAEDYKQFAHWSDGMALIGEGRNDHSANGARLVAEGKQATAALNEYIRQRVEECRAHPGDDLISDMVASPTALTMDEQEIVASNTQLVFAGNESTSKLFGTLMLALAEHPDQRRAIAADRSLIPAAVEEIHRWNSVVHLAWREVKGPQTVGGLQLQDGDGVVCLQGLANRDPARWADPRTLDVRREAKPHLAFGFGIHTCIGIHLARMEAEIWLNRLFDELVDWDVTDVDWGTDWVLRGPCRLDVTTERTVRP